MRRRNLFQSVDKFLILLPLFIFSIGILSIYSAESKLHRLADADLALRQILWMGVGVLALFFIIKIDYFRFRDFVWPLYGVTILFLVLVLFMPSRMGAHRWISLGGLTFQPSELAKLSVIFALAHFFSNNKVEFTPKRKLMIPFFIVGVPFFLILKEPDLGTGLTLIPVFLTMLYFWGFRTRYLIVMIFLALAASPFLFHFLKEYQKTRILVFINPNLDPLGAGYTIIQSKIAIGSGGLLGKGFMGGTQNQLNFLPERHTDFIFGVVGEEGGFLISLVLVLLFFLLVDKGMQICQQTQDRFGSQIAVGSSALLSFQVIVNLGMAMGLFPVVGIPLILVSYGGTSILITMVIVGLLANIKIHNHM